MSAGGVAPGSARVVWPARGAGHRCTAGGAAAGVVMGPNGPLPGDLRKRFEL